MTLRYRLSSLLYFVVLIGFLLWVARLDGGSELLGGLSFWFLAGLLLLGVIRIYSYLLGTLGERQRKKDSPSAEGRLK
jgi:hypothetical protein